MLNFLLAAMSARSEALNLAFGQQTRWSEGNNREIRELRRQRDDRQKRCG